jgi:hypothetical protein
VGSGRWGVGEEDTVGQAGRHVEHGRGADIAKPQAVFITVSTPASEPGVLVGGIDYPNDYIIIIP